VAARAALVIAALAACLWLLAGLRASRLQADAERPFGAERIQAAEIERRRDQLEDARRFNPDPTPEIREAQLLVVAGRDREAVRVLEDVVRREPENYEAWIGLRQAASSVDLPLSRRATREALRLNPLARRDRRDRR
jgi:predicted Zn-dependent protease